MIDEELITRLDELDNCPHPHSEIRRKVSAAGVGIELKGTYFKQAAKNVQGALQPQSAEQMLLGATA